jgi:hypothetical protein
VINWIISSCRICSKRASGRTGRNAAVSVLSLLAILAIPIPLAAYIEDLDALWQDRNPVPRGGCTKFIVKAWPYHHYRDRTSPHDCLVKAIAKYREGDHEYAFGWILGAACPDRLRQDVLLRNAPKVLDHLLRVYGPEVPPQPGVRDSARTAE